MCTNNCNDHGLCIDKACWCDWGWYDEDCRTDGIREWGERSWSGFQAIFVILYAILFVISVWTLGVQMRRDKAMGWKRLVYRLFRSSKNLSLLLLAGIGMLRVLWISIDPLGFKGILNYLEDKILFETVYALIYELYCSALLVLAGLYQGMRATDFHQFKILRRAVILLMILTIPSSVLLSVMKSYRLSYQYVSAFYLSLMVTGVCILVIGFIGIGILLAVYIETHTNLSERRFTESVPTNDYEPSREPRKARTFLAKREKSEGILLASEINRAEHFWDIIQDPERDRKNYSHISKFSEVTIAPAKIPKKQDKCISVITKQDRNTFRKVTVLLTVALILGVFTIFSIIFFTYHVGTLTPPEQFAILYLVLFIENFACYLIYIVFITEIEVQDKNYLLFFSQLQKEKEKNNIEPQIGYPDWLKNISYRLHEFYA